MCQAISMGQMNTMCGKIRPNNQDLITLKMDYIWNVIVGEHQASIKSQSHDSFPQQQNKNFSD